MIKTIMTLFTLIIGQISIAQQQTIVKGRVETNDKRRLPNVEVVIIGAKVVYTNTGGEFQFELPASKYKIGQKISIRVDFPGWQVANPEVLEIFIPSDPEENPIIIRMEKAIDNKGTESLSFANIMVDSSCSYLKEISEPVEKNPLYPFNIYCSQYFQIDPIVTNADISFDVTIMNISDSPLLLTELGFKILKVTELNILPLGDWRAFEVKKDKAYYINIPNVYSELGENLDYKITARLLKYLRQKGVSSPIIDKLKNTKDWLLEYLPHEGYSESSILEYKSQKDRYRGLESYWFQYFIYITLGEKLVDKLDIGGVELLTLSCSINDLNRIVKKDLPDPIYLEKDAPFRFSLTLDDYAKQMPNLSIIQLYAKTNKGIALSNYIYVEFMNVRSEELEH